MESSTIHIAGKEVAVCYCFAAEIAFQDIAGNTVQEAFASIVPNDGGVFDTRAALQLIIVCAIAHAESRGEACTLKMKDLLTSATPVEVAAAVGEIIRLFSEFYKISENDGKSEEVKKK